MMQQSTLKRLRDQIDFGLDQAKRGELLDGEEVFQELERRRATALPPGHKCPG